MKATKALKMINFEEVKKNKHHVDILYKLLRDRRYSISHKSMPLKSDHENFVKDHPYRNWYLIKIKNIYEGAVYLTFNNHISISMNKDKYNYVDDIIDWICSNHDPLSEIKSIRPGYFQMNVPIDDLNLLKILNKLGHKKIQLTYIIGQN